MSPHAISPGTRHAYEIQNLRLAVGESADRLEDLVSKRLGCPATDLLRVEVARRSLDARGHHRPSWVLDVLVDLACPLETLPEATTVYSPMPLPSLPSPHPGLKEESIAIIGSGPCGLFSALILAEMGIRTMIFERGEPVEDRARSVGRLLARSELNPESNYCFGEGGAGTFSDGKLYTRIHEPEVTRVLRMLEELGAPREIRVDRRPHLGTDRLIPLLKSIRRHLCNRGTTFCFSSRVQTVVAEGNRGRLLLNDGTSLVADRVILAPGGSCRDLIASLRATGVAMEAKPFAVGFRVEHPQALIDEIQYGRFAHLVPVPPAEYRLTYHRRAGNDPTGPPDNRDIHVYTFCMCPGGRVVPTATREAELCLNGMSASTRSGRFANAAVVTMVMPGDHPDEEDPVLAGMRFQEDIERRAYALGGGGFRAPAALVTDYLNGRPSRDIGRTSYRCGVQPSDLGGCFPERIHQRIREGLHHFEKKMRGFLSSEAVLLGIETRTSSPVRILRDSACRSISHPFLYPGGEGAGHAGGIVSSAVDGIRIAKAILQGS